MNEQTHPFIIKSGLDNHYEQCSFYTIVKCSGREDGLYRIFCGRKLQGQYEEDAVFHIPGGYYAAFEYSGDMYNIREVFQDDLFRWLIIKEAVIVDNEIGMMTVYPNRYPEEDLVQIFVPVKAPDYGKSQQEKS
jgi:predicted transcriptional regulator YdeE